MNVLGQRNGRLLAAVIIGNALEWYDFVLYGFLAAVMAKHFFPSADPAAALLGSYAAFAATCIVRPLGGILIGLYSDRAGRGPALMLIMGMMSVSMLIMTLTPTYASIGVGATILLILARLLQALSAGGEFGSAASFLLEAVPVHRRGLFSALYSSGTQLAFILAALLGLLITRGMSIATQDAWGWRLPFAVGLLIAPIGYYVRSRLRVAVPAQEAGEKSPSWRAIREQVPRIFLGVMIAAVVNAAAYVFTVYAPTYVVTTLKLPPHTPFIGLLVSGTCSLALVPLMGVVSDRIGKSLTLRIGLVSLFLLVVPLYVWLNRAPSLPRLLACAAGFSLLTASYSATFPAVIAGLFPSEVRATCMALSYNISSTIFGAFSLFFITLIMSRTGNAYVPAYYVSGIAALGLILVSLHPATRRGRGALRGERIAAEGG